MFRGRNTDGRPKYIGRSKAVVKDNRDPLNRGRITVEHPLLGETVWIDYLKLPHQFDVPSIGDIVFIECEAGEYEFPIAWGNVTKGLDEAPEIPEAFKRVVPTNRGIHTPGGHLVEFDDGESNPTKSPSDTDLTTKNRGIRITSSANNKIHIIEDSENSTQYILIEDKNGNMIKLDYQNNELTINSVGKTNFDTAEDRTDSVGGNLSININGNCIINASGDTTVEGSSVKLGAMAVESAIKGDSFKLLFDTHTHTGPSGPPVSPLDPSVLSTKIKIE